MRSVDFSTLLPLPPGLEARHYQQRIIAQAVSLFTGMSTDLSDKNGEALKSLLLESPTGSGKTVMGLGVAAWFAKNRGFSVGWAAMRRNLLAQAAAENARGFGLDLKLISMFDKKPPQVDFLVIDEAQHDAALSMAEPVRTKISKHSIASPAT